MEFKELTKEISVIILGIVILTLAVSFRNTAILYVVLASFAVIIGLNILTKKIVGYFLESNVQIRFWSWYQYGLRKDSHFKNPIPMAWLPLVISLLSKGFVWWLAILDFDVKPRTERVSRRHGLYRFTEMTDWHIAIIAMWGLGINLLAAIVGYLLGFEIFSRLSIYFAAWSLVPLGSLDGGKIFFNSRAIWGTLAIIILALLGWSLVVI
jgi:hypothetical protein